MNKTFSFPVLAFLAAIVLVACNNNDSGEVGFGDASIIAKTEGSRTLFGLRLHVFSTRPLASVNASAGAQPALIYALSPYQDLTTDYLYETAPNKFSVTLPATGDYSFKVTFANGDTITYTNKLYTEFVIPPVITRCAFNPDGKMVEIEWNAVENASFYNLKMVDSKGNIFFISPLFAPNRTAYTFGEDSQGWQNFGFPATDAQMTIELSSYLIEPGSNGMQYQAEGRADAQVAWGS